MSSSRSAAPVRPLAAWSTRGGALIIDLLITAAIELALLLVVWVISGSPRWSAGHTETLLFEVGLPVAVVYAPLLLARGGQRNGQTIGKQAMGVRVIRADGLPLTFATALVREALGRQVPALVTSGLYVPVDYLWPLGDARNQALHDKIGRTLVVGAAGSAPGEPARASAPVAPGEPARALAADGAEPPSAREASGAEPIRGGWLPPVAPPPDRTD